MPSAHFTVIALPHSLAADASHHVSLFISPDLVPDGSQGRLRSFRHFPKWARTLKLATAFELFDQHLRFDPSDPAALESSNAIDPGLDSPMTDEVVLAVEHSILCGTH